jgi:DNA-binding MarR family transcriptional regulator
MADGLHADAERDRVLLGLLELVERDGAQSQRRLAGELGVALGLVNAYLKRCAKKGLIKIKQVPTRRYAYYLTPHGFAEKSRLTVEYLSYSLSFFRRARGDCAAAIDVACARGWKRIALAGVSELAEITTICALERGIEIVGVVDGNAGRDRFVNLPVLSGLPTAINEVDGVIVTDMMAGQATYAAMADAVGPERVLVPSLLGIERQPRERAAR